jgi:hypothetical protein
MKLTAPRIDSEAYSTCSAFRLAPYLLHASPGNTKAGRRGRTPEAMTPPSARLKRTGPQSYTERFMAIPFSLLTSTACWYMTTMSVEDTDITSWFTEQCERESSRVRSGLTVHSFTNGSPRHATQHFSARDHECT